MSNSSRVFYTCMRLASTFPKDGPWQIDTEKSSPAFTARWMTDGSSKYETLLFRERDIGHEITLYAGVKAHAILVDNIHRIFMLDRDVFESLEEIPDNFFSRFCFISAMECNSTKNRNYILGDFLNFKIEETIVDFERSSFSATNAARTRRAINSKQVEGMAPFNFFDIADLECVPFNIRDLESYRNSDFLERSKSQIVAEDLNIRTNKMPGFFDLFSCLYIREDIVEKCMRQRLPGIIPYGGQRQVTLHMRSNCLSASRSKPKGE
jgi:hypothetical protein